MRVPDRSPAELRIVLVCGSVEPGRDGVGDYTRTLAQELVRRGVGVWVVALADRHVEGEVVRELSQVPGGGAIPILRLPGGRPWSSVDQAVAELVAEADPTLLSLQYVPWSFGPRGVAPALGRRLAAAAPGRPWHVMFHETWMSHRGAVRHWVLAEAQRHSILMTLRALGPRLVNVSVAANQQRLARQGWDSSILPIFGSIPPVVIPDPSPRGDRCRVVFFGAPPDDDDLALFAEGLRELGRHRPVTAVLAGGATEARARFGRQLAAALDTDTVLVEDAGFLDPARLSELLLGSDVGALRYAGALAGKSSALLTMLEHGLPVWAPMWTGEPLDLPFRAELVFQRLADATEAQRLPPASFVTEVAEQFLHQVRAVLS